MPAVTVYWSHCRGIAVHVVLSYCCPQQGPYWLDTSSAALSVYCQELLSGGRKEEGCSLSSAAFFLSLHPVGIATTGDWISGNLSSKISILFLLQSVFSFEVFKRRLRKALINTWRETAKRMEPRSSWWCSVLEQRQWALPEIQELPSGHQASLSHCKGDWALAQAAQVGCEISVPGDIQKQLDTVLAHPL